MFKEVAINAKDPLRPRSHEQIKPHPLFAKIIDPYGVTPDEFAQK